MAITFNENGTNTPNGAHLWFSYTFPVIKTEDIKVALNGLIQATTKYTIDSTANPTRITFNATSIDSDLQETTTADGKVAGAPKEGVIVKVYRETDVDSAQAVYAAGSSIRALDLNNNQDQVLYALQEEQNQQGTFASISLDDDAKLKFGNSHDFTIEWDSAPIPTGRMVSNGPIVYDGTGHLFINGDTNLFEVSSLGTVSHVNVFPYTDGSIDLGKSDKEWKDLYVDGTGYIDTVNADSLAVSGVSTFGSNITVSGHTMLQTVQCSYVSSDLITQVSAPATVGYDLGQSNRRWDQCHFKDVFNYGDIQIGSSNSDTVTLNSKIGSNILPTGTRNIGASDNRWNKIWTTDLDVSGTITLAAGSIGTSEIADDAVTTDKLANSINTEIAANTAKTTNATHSGEVTGATALTIADDVVDEANLKISNAGSDGQYLQKQSGNTGGLTWATVSQTDTTYTHTWQDSSDNAILRLTAGGSGSGNDDLTIVAGDNITLTPSEDNLTIAASGGEITVKDETTTLATAATTLKFTGSGVTASGSGAEKTITIGGGATDFKYLELKGENDTSVAFSAGSASYELVLSGTTTAVSPTAASALLLSLNGVIQKPNTGTSIGSNDGFCLDGSSIHFGDDLTAAPDFIIYLEHAGIGSPSDLAVTTAKIADDAVTADKLANSINTEIAANTAKVTNATHTGEVTGSTALTIANDAVKTAKIEDDAVTYAKIQNVSATDRILGRDSSGAGVIEEISPSSLRTMINVEDGATADQSASDIKTLLNSSGLVDAQIDGSAAIAGSKISPNFGSQNIVTTGLIEVAATSCHIDLMETSATNHRIRNGSGNFQIQRISDDKNTTEPQLLIDGGTGAVKLYHDGSTNPKLETYSNGVKCYNHCRVEGGEGENAVLALYADEGDDAADLWIMAANTSGALEIQQWNGSAWEDVIKATGGGAVELYYDGGTTPKLETTSSGASVTGSISVDAGSNTTQAIFSGSGGSGARGLAILTESTGSADEGVIFNARASGTTATMKFQTNSSTALTIQGEGDEIDIPNDTKLRFGDGNDLQIYYDGTRNIIDAATSKNIDFYYNGAQQFWFGDSEFKGKDDKKIILGTGDDLQIYHNGTHSFIDNATGHLILTSTATDNVDIMKSGHSEYMARFKPDNAVELYYDGGTDPKLETYSGGVLIGRTSAGNTGNGHTLRGADSCIFSRDSTGETLQVARNDSNGDLIQFRSGDTGNATVCGEIVRTSSSSVNYNEESDYRLKENEVAISDGITRLKLLKPYRFNFKAEPSRTFDGFFAHEAQAVVPESVYGEKDDPNRMQGIDKSKIVPLLTAALQEAITKIETLETKVAALEAK